jgi:hypothetical protein
MSKKVKLGTSYEALKAQRDQFLIDHGFEGEDAAKTLFPQIIQHLPQTQDWYDPEEMAASIRKALANEAAYYLMKPAAYEKLIADREAAKTPVEGGDGQE